MRDAWGDQTPLVETSTPWAVPSADFRKIYSVTRERFYFSLKSVRSYSSSHCEIYYNIIYKFFALHWTARILITFAVKVLEVSISHCI